MNNDFGNTWNLVCTDADQQPHLGAWTVAKTIALAVPGGWLVRIDMWSAKAAHGFSISDLEHTRMVRTSVGTPVFVPRLVQS